MKKIHITTLGCSKNTVDSEVLMGRILKTGHVLTENPEEADVIILNTCGFIEDAKKESIQAIFEALELKKNDPAKQVYVAGCLSQRYPTQISSEIPEVDDVFGTEAFDEITRKIGTSHAAAHHEHQFRKLITPGHFAYLKIAEGCDHTCSFCAIPGIRGKYRSREIDEIMDEAKFLVESGVKEIILISQDSSYYGIDLYGEQRIVQLLEKMLRIEGIEWLRVLYWYPNNFPMEVISLMKSSDKLVSYLDLPMQHISAAVLKRMRRSGTRTRLERIFHTVRQKAPEIGLRTTMILGYPGETEDDFKQLYDFVGEIRFDRLGTFVYSDEDHTPAYHQGNKIQSTVARKRQQMIMELQKEISLTHNRNMIGKDITVLIDEYDEDTDTYVGRTYKDAPEIDNEVLIRNHHETILQPGAFVKVNVTDASEYELYA